MLPLEPLPRVVIEQLVRLALAEDLGEAGDVTSAATIPESAVWRCVLRVRQKGVIAGLDLAQLAFELADSRIVFTPCVKDGAVVTDGAVLAKIAGPARGILAGERVALNYLSHLSGIASATHELVELVKPHKARVLDTRKTMPNMRALEKYAVRCGGGVNHRFGLHDMILIKDNHIAVAGGVVAALRAAHAHNDRKVKIEIEVDRLDQLAEILALPAREYPDVIMLDNMDVPILTRAVELTAGRVALEASGGVNRVTINAMAATGVDMISVGAITHSAPILDIGLDAVD